MKKLAILLLIMAVSSGCATMPWWTTGKQMTVKEAMELSKAQGGSGCMYLRVTGTYPGFASGAVLIVEAYDMSSTKSQRVDFIDCLKAIPEAQRVNMVTP